MNSASPTSEPARRPYRSSRRTEQARATRRAIAAAARTLFLERGWEGTRLRDVAEAAGVAEPTVYATYGSKAGLALALMDSADEVADVDALRSKLDTLTGDPHAQLAAVLAFDRRLLERAGDLVALVRDAGPAAPDLAAAYADGIRRGDTGRRTLFGSWPAGTIQPGIGIDDAVDMYAAVCNIDTWRVLTSRGWTADRIEAWWRESVLRLLMVVPQEKP